MLEEKDTAELMDELKGTGSFSQYIAENGEAFLSADAESRSACPFCGGLLRADASYCTHCMRVLSARRVIGNEEKKARRAPRVFLCVFGALLAALAVFFAVRAGKEQTPSVLLPAPEEFRALAAGALRNADQETRALWPPETLTKTGAKGGLTVYETETVLSDIPACAAFSEDGKRLFFALFEISHKDSHKALQAVKTAFSAVYRRVPENLEELLTREGAFQTYGAPDEALNAFLTAAGRTLAGNAAQGASEGTGPEQEGAVRIEASLPIRADGEEKGIVSRVYKVTGGETFDLVVLFETEAS